MILTWSMAKHFMQRVGAWKLYKSFFVLTSEQKPLYPAHKVVGGAVRCQVRWDLLAAFISMMLKNQAGAQVPDFEFKKFGTSSAPSECRPCGTPSESSTSECRPCRIPGESGTSTPCGLICIKDEGIQRQKGVNPIAGMQMIPTGLLSCEEQMVFIVDS